MGNAMVRVPLGSRLMRSAAQLRATHGRYVIDHDGLEVYRAHALDDVLDYLRTLDDHRGLRVTNEDLVDERHDGLTYEERLAVEEVL